MIKYLDNKYLNLLFGVGAIFSGVLSVGSALVGDITSSGIAFTIFCFVSGISFLISAFVQHQQPENRLTLLKYADRIMGIALVLFGLSFVLAGAKIGYIFIVLALPLVVGFVNRSQP